MQVQITLTDSSNVAHFFLAMPKEIDDAVKKGLSKVTAEMKREITGPLGLSKYPRHKPGTKTPSPATGTEPPAQITTDLRRSIRLGATRRKGFGFYEKDVEAGWLHYAEIQEYGLNGLPKRPFVGPAFTRITSNRRAENIFMDSIRDVLQSRP